MAEKFYIVIDTLGSDKGFKPIVLGAKLILESDPDVCVCLVGSESDIKSEVEALGMDKSRVEIVNTTEVVTNFDHALEAFKGKPDASIFKAMKILKSDEKYIGMLTAGNSGALILGSALLLPDEHRSRPCLAAVLPVEKGKYTCLVDTGATIDCEPYQLHQFAKFGSDFMKKVYKIESPRIGLLSNGAESAKGNKLVKATYPLLEGDKELNFVGNIEGNKALAGLCDVLVCDGFAGNQVLKNSEGIATKLITDMVKYSKMKQNMFGMELAQYLMQMYDFESLGGGIVLGASKLVIKCRGSSGELAIKNTGSILVNMHLNKSVYEGRE